VRHGGALLLVAGPEFATPASLDQTPLASVLPAHAPLSADGVVEGAFRPAITALGARHPVTQGLAGANDPGKPGSEASWGPWYRAIDAEDVQGQVLITGPGGRPLLILNHVDQGRAALLMSDQSWLWSRGHMGGGPQAEMLRRVAHWLMKEPELEEEALRAKARGHDLAIERQSLKPETPPITITGPDGATRTVTLGPAEPGLSRATLTVDQDGLYRASDGEHVALVNVGPDNPLEFQEVVSTTEHLRPLAEATGGSARRLASRADDPIDVPRLIDMHEAPIYAGGDYIGLKRTESSVLIGVGRTALAAEFLGLAVLLGALVLLWCRAGRGGRFRGVG
jgi:hypothetical protein